MGDCASYFWWRLLETAGWVYHDGLRPTIFSGNSRGYFSKCPNCWCIGNFNRKMMINQKFQDDFFTSENEDFSATILWGFMNVSSTIWFVQQNWGFTSCQMHKSRKNQQISGGVSTRNWGKMFRFSDPLGDVLYEIPRATTWEIQGTYSWQFHWVISIPRPQDLRLGFVPLIPLDMDKNVVQVSSVAPFTSTMTSFTYAAKKMKKNHFQ